MADEQVMSSEESTKQELAQEALDSAEEKVVEPEQTVPLGKHTALRHRAQTAELEAAELRGRVSALESMNITQAPTQLSPIDREVARQIEAGEIENADEVVITGKLFKEQQAYMNDINAQLADAEATKSLGVQQVASIAATRLVHDDFDDVVGRGQNLLTKGQMLDITNAGENYATMAYDMSKAALEKQTPAKVDEAAPKKEPSELEAEKAAAAAKAKEVVPSQEEILKGQKSSDARIDHLMNL
jgi:hypothetical protein